ncbi:MAG TPA: lysylphosphatidylglycerol synthase transmembrane domain-containing protein [Chloroflexota bacterium]
MSAPPPAPPDEPADPGLGRRIFNLRTLLSFVVGFGLLVFLFTRLNLDLAQTIGTMRRADPLLLLAALAVYYLTFPVRGERWRHMLRSAGVANAPSPLVLGGMIFLSWFMNCLVPAKLGDVYRAYLLRKRGGVSLSFAGGTVVAERLIDFAFVLILLGASGLVVFRGRMPDQVVPFLEIGAVVVLGAGIALLAIRRWERLVPRLLPARLHGVYERFHVGTIGAFGSYGWLLLYTPLGWLAEIFRFWLVGLALGLFTAESFGQQLAISTFVALGSAIFTTAAPTPGGLGAAELAIVAALALIGKSGELAIAAALLDRLISYWSLVLFGFVLYFAWEARSTVPAPTVPHHARRD